MNLSDLKPLRGSGKKLYVETYGCQMNVGDSEILVSIMQDDGYRYTEDIAQADIILVNTCSIRDNAEQRIWGRLKEFRRYKRQKPSLVVGIVGCMAERLRGELLEKEPVVDVVAGPDSYRDMPKLVREAMTGETGVNVLLSQEETYADVRPVRLDRNGVSAFVSIMRGCNNYCSYCVVPYTRGVERSRDPQTILREVRELFDAGYREVTLLGQNVNSYKWAGGENSTDGTAEVIDFPALMAMVAGVSPLLRVRFATSHPKDLSDKLLEVMAAHPNICSAIHLPAQSGSSRMLKLMNRKYSREWYLERIASIRRHLPEAAITTDLIAGFCGETPEDHAETLSLMREAGFASAFMFKYSERPGTQAQKHMADDVDESVKTARLTEIIELQNELSLAGNRRDVGHTFEVLVEGASRRSDRQAREQADETGETSGHAIQMCGRTSQNKMVVFDTDGLLKAGDYARVTITDCSSATLFGQLKMDN